jgi:hypothetical protein
VGQRVHALYLANRHLEQFPSSFFTDFVTAHYPKAHVVSICSEIFCGIHVALQVRKEIPHGNNWNKRSGQIFFSVGEN